MTNLKIHVKEHHKMNQYKGVVCSLGVLLSALFSVNSGATQLPTNCQTTTCVEHFNDFKVAAKRGHPQAMATLGQFYYHAYGTEKDVGKALTYFKKASRLGGDTAAQFKAGFIYLSEPSHKDIDKGIEYLKKAGKKDYKASNFVLGMVYFDESFGKQDYKLADKYFADAYKQKFGEVAKVATYIEQENDVSIKSFPLLAKAMEEYPLAKANDGSITWPQDEMEVITVSSPPLDTVLRDQLVRYRRPIKTTGSRFTGKSCAQSVSCYGTDGVEGMSDYSFLFVNYNRAASGGGQ